MACKSSSPRQHRAGAVVSSNETGQTGRCASKNPTAIFTLGESGSEPDGSDVPADGSSTDDQPRDLPYSVEVGEALAYPSGFAVAALKSSAHSTNAVVALVDEQVASGRTVDLGSVHGSAPPPRLAFGARGIVVAVADSDASGGTVRLASIDDRTGKAKLDWGKELEEGWEVSGTFDVALNDTHGVLVWDAPERGRMCGRIRAVHFATDALAPSKAPAVISPRGVSAEAPRIVSRPGGFWLAWISRPGCGKDAASKRRDAQEDQTPALELGAGALEVVALQPNGEQSGESTRITALGAHVIAYDIVALPNGGALLVFRDDTASPGAEQGLARIAHLGADGTVERTDLEDEAIGAGVPALLVDDQSGGGPSVWLALEAIAEGTRLGRLSLSGVLLEPLEREPAVGGGEILAARKDRLLVGIPRGRGVELSTVTCGTGKTRSAPH